MDVLTGEIKTEKGFLESVEKKIFKTEDTVWVSESYVTILETEMGKIISIAQDALKIAGMVRGIDKENPEKENS